MKGFLINPETKEITEIEVATPILDSLYKHTDCDCVCSVRVSDKDILWLDDEGMLKQNWYFTLASYPQPLAGKGVVLGVAPDGDNANASITLDELKNLISFY